jgi:hypothetical protein
VVVRQPCVVSRLFVRSIHELCFCTFPDALPFRSHHTPTAILSELTELGDALERAAEGGILTARGSLSRH